MGPANDYWPADLGGTRRTCPVHTQRSTAYVGQTREFVESSGNRLLEYFVPSGRTFSLSLSLSFSLWMQPATVDSQSR